MGLLDGLFSGGSAGGLLDFLRQNAGAAISNNPGGLPSDTAQYGAGAMAQMPSPIMQPSQPNAQMVPQQPPPVIAAQQPSVNAPQPLPPALGGNSFGGNLGAGLQNFVNAGGPLQALAGGLTGLFTGQRSDPAGIAQANLKAQYDSLVPVLGPQKALLAVMNPEAGKELFKQFAPQDPQNLGQGWVLPHGSNKAVRLYEPDETTPQSVREYQYYTKNLPAGQQPMDYATWSTSKARAGATNISNNIDMNSGQAYDRQLAEGLGKAHTALSNGVEDAQTRARDIAAMQGAVDAIQKNNGTTGGLAPAQRLELQKSINAGAAALGIEKPFSESDLSDKEFLTKFNRSMAGAQAKNAVGNRVTNFEMSNFLKANPGLDMTVTGNQRLLGIQAQIEQRNIAVGNAIRDATAEAISKSEKISPVTVQKIITAYDEAHHIQDPVTGQDLTQSYSLPEFQNSNPTNKSMSEQHEQNVQGMQKTIGGKTYYKAPDGHWYVK